VLKNCSNSFNVIRSNGSVSKAKSPVSSDDVDDYDDADNYEAVDEDVCTFGRRNFKYLASI
jgi:hypothetical protein